MRKGATVIIALLVVILFAVSNPSPDRHKQAIRDQISQREPLVSALGMGFLASNLLTYHPFLVGSYTKLDGDVATVGALGFVWVNYDALDI